VNLQTGLLLGTFASIFFMAEKIANIAECIAKQTTSSRSLAYACAISQLHGLLYSDGEY